MRSYRYTSLSPRELYRLLRRPSADPEKLISTVRRIIEAVRANGDDAVRTYARRFDGVLSENLRVSKREFSDARRNTPKTTKSALRSAAKSIEAFHRLQFPNREVVTRASGRRCRLQWRPVRRVGLYVPGGSAPLISTVLMLGIPARLAGCTDIVICTPPSEKNLVQPELLFAAEYVGIRMVFKVGGAQAIAAMACGTDSIPKVEKIFGPGNPYVTTAKMLVSQPPYDVAIDMPAGPTELLIIADEEANPRWVAADLLSQAEHGADSQVVLLSTSARFVGAVEQALSEQIATLPRRTIAERALANSFSITVTSIEKAIEFSNRYAPEHLILACRRARNLSGKITNAGSVFVGPFSSVVFGDYVSGPNHSLPTGGWARSVGGLTLQNFMKSVFFQEVSSSGFSDLAESAKSLARAEGLEGHARAISIRESMR